MVLVAAACSGSRHKGPTQPTASPPQITCPADVTVGSAPGPSQPVTYPAPTVTNGTNPVTVTCTPASESTFSLGTTPVACVARDADSREATCSFNVTLNGFTLSITTFLAVGDSLTAGENGQSIGIPIIDPANSYPTKLQALFDASYPGQGITVINRGVAGQKVEETRDQLPRNLNRDRPQAVLILSGYNDLSNCGRGQLATLDCREAIDRVAFGIRDCIRESKESPVGVKYTFASTLTPPGPVGGKRIDPDAITQVNSRIRQMVASEKATLVDTYPLFVGHEAEYTSQDGLHLTPAGYQALAESFFAAIRATVAQSPNVSLGRGR